MKKLNAFVFLSLFAMIVFCSSKEASVKEFIVDTSENVTTRLGGDLDEHGCDVSGGYTWSEVLQDCIRLFERGIRVEKIDGNGAAFLVFSGDSIRVELFFSDGRKSEILEQHALPEGGYAWSATDDDGTKNVQLIEGLWTISQRGRIIYRQQQSENDAALGRLQVRTYEGLLPCASCPGIRYTLTVRNREYSGDGSFWLLLTYLDAEQGEDRSFVYTGKRFTQRGIPNDNNATVWQLVADDGETIFNFLYEDEKTLIRLNDKFEKSKTNLNYSLKLIKSKIY